MATVVSALAQNPGPVQDNDALDSMFVRRFNFAGINLERNLNTFNWTGRAFLDTAAWGTAVKVRQQYTSSIILLNLTSPLARNLQSNQENLSLVLRHPLTPEFSPELHWNSIVYSDNKSVGLGTVSSHSILGGAEYYPVNIFSLVPLIGYRWENQLGMRDRGLSYTLLGRTHGIDLDGYQLTGRAQFHQDLLNPRILERDSIRLSTQKFFSFGTQDSLDIGYSKNRSEFYLVSDGNIESRIENGFSISNFLEYAFNENFATSVFFNIAARSLDKDIRRFSSVPDSSIRVNTAIDESVLDAYVQSTYTSDARAFTAAVRLGHGERNEEHSVKPILGATVQQEAEVTRRSKEEHTKDNITSRTSLSGLCNIALSSSDTLRFAAGANILRYDTPSELNVEDRDELLVAFSIATAHRASRYLNIGVTLEGTVSHVVYLLSDRSANNNINRILRLAPTATYRPSKSIVSTNTFEVLANYTVYDFEADVSSVESFSYRQFAWIDSSSIELTHRFGLDFFSYLKFYERGQLVWADFSERPENSFVDRTFAAQARFSPEGGTMFALGLRYFTQERYGFTNGVKTFESSLTSFGPTCMIFWDIGAHSRLMITGWYETRSSRDSQHKTMKGTPQPNLTMAITINL